MPVQEPDRLHAGLADRRADILAAAGQHFRLYGYDKTTVSDIARAVGFSPAYIYKFFESKQALGEAICRECLSGIDAALVRVAASDASPSSKIISIFHTLAECAEDLALTECRLKDMVVAAHDGRWPAFEAHEARLAEIVARTVKAGRRAGVFERVTPIEETCQAILWVLEPFRNPGLWSAKAGALKTQATVLSALVLRSLNSR